MYPTNTTHPNGAVTNGKPARTSLFGIAPTSSGAFAGYPDLLTVNDLRSLTGLSCQTIRAEINRGALPGCRIGRRLYVPKKHFLEYVEKGGGLR